MVNPRTQTPVVFAWGDSVFACTDATWHTILRCIAKGEEHRLVDLVQTRSRRLATRPLVQLGSMSKDEAQARLAARKTALGDAFEGYGLVPEPAPVIETVIR